MFNTDTPTCTAAEKTTLTGLIAAAHDVVGRIEAHVYNGPSGALSNGPATQPMSHIVSMKEDMDRLIGRLLAVAEAVDHL